MWESPETGIFFGACGKKLPLGRSFLLQEKLLNLHLSMSPIIC